MPSLPLLDYTVIQDETYGVPDIHSCSGVDLSQKKCIEKKGLPGRLIWAWSNIVFHGIHEIHIHSFSQNPLPWSLVQ